MPKPCPVSRFIMAGGSPRFSETAEGIEADIEQVSDGKTHRIRSAFLVGADGPRSTVRQALGFQYSGEEGAVRDFFGGRMFAIYLRAPEFYRAVPHPPAWMNVTFNHERRAFMAAVDGKGEFAFHTQLRPHEVEGEITRERALAMFQEAVGAPIQAEILSQGTWIAGYALVADQFRRGRVFIAGDAAHLFTPAGGLGYNTAIEDAVNLGWKLAATIRGSGGPALLSSYEAERQPNATTQHRLRAAVCRISGIVRAGHRRSRTRHPAVRKHAAWPATISRRTARPNSISPESPSARDTTPRRSRFQMERSRRPMRPICMFPQPAPADAHLICGCRRSNPSTTSSALNGRLLRLSDRADGRQMAAAASALGLDMKVVDLRSDEARDLYQADLVLIRPDQIVAWRGNSDETATDILRRVLGRE